MLKTANIKEFWEHVDCGIDDECWPWLGPINSLGGVPEFTYCLYPGILLTQKARGIAYQLAHGWDSIPIGAYVYATCGNSLCVNPAHLKLGYTIIDTKGLTKAQQRAFNHFQGTKRK